MAPAKEYDIVLLGATGYTGKLCAEHITTSTPTILRCPVAGRSGSKLQELVNNLEELIPDRLQPAIETLQLNDVELKAVAKKANIILNCVGPYHLYSTPVVQACAETGTHYLDV